jgi:pimeloyl-ACP methyl ester carboxylesterase
MKHIIFCDKKIFYRVEGKGKPVMLVHGFAEDGNIWKYQVEKLREHFRVIVPDIPGSGKSDRLDGEISLEDYAKVLKAIADKEIAVTETGEENLFTLIGHSMGGYITMAFAEKYPGSLNAFGLFHSSAYEDDEAKKNMRRKGIEFIRNNGAPAFLRTATPNLFSKKTRECNPELVEELIEETKYFSPESLIQYYEAMIQRPDRTCVLKTFSKPVLFIIGKYDNAVPLQSALQQCHLPGISHIHILQNSAHMGMWEERDKATQSLFSFLNQ